MPRFHFHICDATSTVGDGEGLVMISEDAAIAEAQRFARELIATEVREDGIVRLDQAIEIVRPDGKLLKRVEFAEVIRIDTT